MFSYTVMFDALHPHELQPAKLLYPWDSPGKNTGVGCHFLPQRIFPTQGSNLPLLHWQADSLSLHHLGSPITLLVRSDYDGVLGTSPLSRGEGSTRMSPGDSCLITFRSTFHLGCGTGVFDWSVYISSRAEAKSVRERMGSGSLGG